MCVQCRKARTGACPCIEGNSPGSQRQSSVLPHQPDPAEAARHCRVKIPLTINSLSNKQQAVKLQNSTVFFWIKPASLKLCGYRVSAVTPCNSSNVQRRESTPNKAFTAHVRRSAQCENALGLALGVRRLWSRRGPGAGESSLSWATAQRTGFHCENKSRCRNLCNHQRTLDSGDLFEDLAS